MRNLLVVIALSIFSFSLTAQIMVGPKVNVGMSTYKLDKNLDDLYDAGAKVQFGGGVKVRIPLFAGIELIPEVIYSAKGGSVNPDIPIMENEDVYDHHSLRTHHFEVPLLVAYKFRGKEFAPFIFLGPSLEVTLSGKENVEFKDEDGGAVKFETMDRLELEDQEYKLEIGKGRFDDLSKTKMNFVAGAGFYYEMDLGRLVVDVRMNMGTKNIFNETAEGYSGVELKNRSVELSIGYLFDF